ncbi:DUF2513 domain-containing protein [Agrilactobacillus fermenti]|uniref:DUF2513 domain-containing protein n=1 Tax=Agrilactobacillus fermenti TaxID=2586909 RepID=UPI003A5BEB56
MKLDPDCIRDVLLVVESSSSFSKQVGLDDFVHAGLLKKYDFESVMYHIRQANYSGLLENVKFTMGPDVIIKDLSPEGHKFLNDIREDTNWNKTKSIAKKVGSFSLDTLKTVSSDVISSLINQQFHL